MPGPTFMPVLSGGSWAPQPWEAQVTGADSSVVGLENFVPSRYPRTRAARAAQSVLTGGVSWPVLCVGDSTTEGFNGSTANCVSQSWVRRLADLLTARGYKAGWQNVLGDHRADTQGPSNIQTIDTRVTALPADWSLANGIGIAPGIGGNFWINQSNVNPFTFSPTVPTDTLDVFYFDFSGYDTITVKSGAAGATAATTGGTISITASSRIKKATATYTLGTNVWTVQKTTANAAALILMGVSAYNSTLPEVSLLNLGCGSQLTAYFADIANQWSSLSSVSLAGSGLITTTAIIDVGINDWFVPTSQAVMVATLTTIVTTLQAAGTEVLFIVPVPSALGSASAANQAAINNAIISVAYATGCAFISMAKRWRSQALAQPLGYYGDVTIHPSTIGYSDKAEAISQFFFAL